MDFDIMVFHILDDSCHISLNLLYFLSNEALLFYFFFTQAILVIYNCTTFQWSMPFLRQICSKEGHKILAEILIAVNADVITAFLESVC